MSQTQDQGALLFGGKAADVFQAQRHFRENRKARNRSVPSGERGDRAGAGLRAAAGHPSELSGSLQEMVLLFMSFCV